METPRTPDRENSRESVLDDDRLLNALSITAVVIWAGLVTCAARAVYAMTADDWRRAAHLLRLVAGLD